MGVQRQRHRAAQRSEIQLQGLLGFVGHGDDFAVRERAASIGIARKAVSQQTAAGASPVVVRGRPRVRLSPGDRSCNGWKARRSPGDARKPGAAEPPEGFVSQLSPGDSCSGIAERRTQFRRVGPPPRGQGRSARAVPVQGCGWLDVAAVTAQGVDGEPPSPAQALNSL